MGGFNNLLQLRARGGPVSPWGGGQGGFSPQPIYGGSGSAPIAGPMPGGPGMPIGGIYGGSGSAGGGYPPIPPVGPAPVQPPYGGGYPPVPGGPSGGGYPSGPIGSPGGPMPINPYLPIHPVGPEPVGPGMPPIRPVGPAPVGGGGYPPVHGGPIRGWGDGSYNLGNFGLLQQLMQQRMNGYGG